MGLIHTIKTYWHFYDESRPPKARWGTDDIPDLLGKVMLVTGANAGIGYATARVLLEKNAKVYITCRSAKKAEEAADKLEKEVGTSRRPEVLVLDLADLKSVKRAVEEFRR